MSVETGGEDGGEGEGRHGSIPEAIAVAIVAWLPRPNSYANL